MRAKPIQAIKTVCTFCIYRSCHLRELRLLLKTLLKCCQLPLGPTVCLQSVPTDIRGQTTDGHSDHEIYQSGLVRVKPSECRQGCQIFQGACETAIVQVVDRRSVQSLGS